MSTTPKPRDRRPAPEDNRTELQKALAATAEATTTAAQAMAEAAQWRIAYEYGLEEEDLDFFFSLPINTNLIKLALRIGTKQPTLAPPAADETTNGDTADQL